MPKKDENYKKAQKDVQSKVIANLKKKWNLE